MFFKDILGQQHIKSHLKHSADAGRVPHAQLFVGPEGSGTLVMAIAYAQYLICGTGSNPSEREACNLKFETLSHPDLHFAFPVATSQSVKSNPVSNHYMEAWRSFISETPYGGIYDWYQRIGIEKKQGLISVHEAQDISKKLALKSYEGGYKILIIWMAEKMGAQTANKLLKLIEEPPPNTVLLLITENEEQIIQTIRSRCQVLHFPGLPEQVMAEALMARNIDSDLAQQIAQQANGNFKTALDLVGNDTADLLFEKWFVQWVRMAFKAKGNKAVARELVAWAEEVSIAGREVQKQFLNYGLSVIRQAMLIHYKVPELAFMRMKSSDFNLNKFAPFVHENNVESLVEEIERAIFHVERNGNAKLIFTDLSIKLTRLLHTPATAVS